MVFGSWTFSAEQLDYIEYFGNNTWVDFADYMESAVWDMCVNQIATTAAKVQPERGQPPQSRLIITIKIRRKTLFYLVNLIIPVVLISFLSTGVFYLPSDACEKITLCISILISIVVFILLVVKILPPTSVTVPLISKYLLFTFIMNVISIFTTVIVINWHFRSPHSHRMRRWVKVFFLNYLPRILLMKRPNHDEQYRKFLRQSEVKSSPSSPPGAVRPQYGVPEGSPLRPTPSTNNASPWIKPLEQNNKHVVTEETKPISKEIYEATDAVDYITGQLKFQDEYNRVSIKHI